MMERNGPPSAVLGSNDAEDKERNLDKVLDKFATEKRLSGKVHEKPVTLTELNQKLAPKKT